MTRKEPLRSESSSTLRSGVLYADASDSRCAVTISRDAFQTMPVVEPSIAPNVVGSLMGAVVDRPDALPAKTGAGNAMRAPEPRSSAVIPVPHCPY